MPYKGEGLLRQSSQGKGGNCLGREGEEELGIPVNFTHAQILTHTHERTRTQAARLFAYTNWLLRFCRGSSPRL